MKANETLLYALGEVDAKWIPAGADDGRRTTSFRRGAAIGGGICAALLIGFFLFRFPFFGSKNSGGGEDMQKYENLPKITAQIANGAMGFEGLMEYSADELENGNPWREIPADTSVLPVYENLLYTDRWEEGPNWYGTESEMMRAAEEAAAALGMEILSSETEMSSYVKDGVSEETAWLVIAVCGSENGSATVRVFRHGTVTVDLTAPVPLSASDPESRILEAAELFGDFLGYEKAAAAVSRDYGYDSEEGVAYANEDNKAYADAADPVRKLLNYSVECARFRLETGEDGTCSVYTVSKGPGMSGIRYVGDYPIISEAEAREMLLRGEYLTTVPADLLQDGRIAEDRVDRAELIYRLSGREEYVEPYYRFCVRLKDGFPAASEAGLSDWGVFYVPAVRAEYLAEIPVWDGSFN